MKNSISGRRRVIGIIVTAAMLCTALLFAGCEKKVGDGQQTDVIQKEILQLDLSTADQLFVVRSERASKAVIDEMVSLSNDIKKITSTAVKLSDDWYRDEAEIDRYEILIGKANRSEIAESYSTLRADDYVIRFSDKKIWILGGNDESTIAASAIFRKLINEQGILKFEAPDGIIAEHTGEYEINERLLLGSEFRDYKLLYTSVSYEQVGAVARFLDQIQSSSGYVLDSIAVPNTKCDCKILLKSNYDNGGPIPIYDYEVINDGTAITVYGGSNKAFRQGLKLLYESFAKGELRDADSRITIKGSYNYLTDDVYDILKGIRMYAMGDSYFAGSDIDRGMVWPSLLAKKYDMRFINYGIGGSTISNFDTEHNPMVDRISQMIKAEPDIVLFEGGRNDFSLLTPLGDKNSRDSRTFRGAIRLSLEELHRKYPNALVICVTNWNFPGNHGIADSKGYARTFEEIAGEYDFAVCINATNLNNIPVDTTNEAFRTEYFIKPTDISHLNVNGMRYVTPYFEELIAEYYTAFKNGTLAK